MQESEVVYLRWPIRLKKAMELYAKKQGTTLQTVVTEIVLDKFGIEHWRKEPERKRKEKIADILKVYNYIPNDIQFEINHILRMK